MVRILNVRYSVNGFSLVLVMISYGRFCMGDLQGAHKN